jgi:hypothetical protein
MPLTTWRKSSFSSASDDNCVEVAFAVTGTAVRDSKNPNGPVLTIGTRGWLALTANPPR